MCSNGGNFIKHLTHGDIGNMKKTCTCEVIKGIGKAHTMECVFGRLRKVTVKGWAFLQSDGNFITDFEGGDTIYLKKPEPRRNPFDYLSAKRTWKPTEITISFELPKRKK